LEFEGVDLKSNSTKIEHQYFTAAQLEKMIGDYVGYWSDPSGKSDIEAETANVLNKNCLQISQQLLMLLLEENARR
jgi:hypothetical protein